MQIYMKRGIPTVEQIHTVHTVMWYLIFHILLQAIITCSAVLRNSTSQNFDSVKVSKIKWLPEANITVQTNLECASLCHNSISSFCCQSFFINMTNGSSKHCWLSRQTFEVSDPPTGDGISDVTIFVRREPAQDCEKAEPSGDHCIQECAF